MANIARDIFKAYDIRGIVGKTLTNEAAYFIGKAIATRAAQKSITRNKPWYCYQAIGNEGDEKRLVFKKD